MNKGDKLKQMRKFILQYGDIIEEYTRPSCKEIQSYRKRSYYINFNSKRLGLSCSIGSENRYSAYKELFNMINKLLQRKD